MPVLRLRPVPLRLALTLTLLILLIGCAGMREARQERDAIEEEAAQEAAFLEDTSSDHALLDVARARHSRGVGDGLSRWAGHADARVRRETIRALGLIGDPATQGAIAAALQDDDPAVRAAAAFGLSQLWAWPLAPLERVSAEAIAEVALDAALSDELDDLRRGDGSLLAAGALVRALGEIGDTPTEDTLWELAANPDAAPGLRRQAWFALGVRGKRGHAISAKRVPATQAGLTGATAFAAAWAVGRSSVDADAQAALEQALLSALDDADGDAAAWLLRALGRTAGEGAMARWQQELTGDDPRRRLNVVRGAAAASATDVLVAASTDPDPQIASEALRGLGTTNDESAWQALQPRATLSDALEAARLAGLAGHLNDGPEPGARDQEILSAALAAAEDPRPAVRAAAYDLLGAHPRAEGAPALLTRVALEEDAAGRLALAGAIAARKDPAVEAQLLAWLDGDDPTLGAIAAEGLGPRLDAHITAALLGAWRTHAQPADWERRVAIMRAVGEREAVPPDFFGEALHDDSAHVRLAAFFALSKRAGRAQAGSPPLAEPETALSDPWFGVADVERAVVTTSRGDITLLLYPKAAPAAVANFVRLAEDGFFDGLVFHRVVPDFVVQTGDPTGTGWGGPGWTIPDEFSALEYRRGTVGMARSDKDTAGSQWFVTHSPQPHLTGHYTAFGQLMTGWAVLDAIREGDRVETVVIQRKAP